MLKRRIIPCLDVRYGKVIKGVKFKSHEIVGDIVALAEDYCRQGADELVFYDIVASCNGSVVDQSWISKIAKKINIPFCVAGGIDSVDTAASILACGADKLSINSPALDNPDLINDLSKRFGSQSIVVSIDSYRCNNEYLVYQYTGDEKKMRSVGYKTVDWAKEAVSRGAGEIVLNCMNQDGVRNGYDIAQLADFANSVSVPVIASGGAGDLVHFRDVFEKTGVTGALAASVFHKRLIEIKALKQYLQACRVEVRLC